MKRSTSTRLKVGSVAFGTCALVMGTIGAAPASADGGGHHDGHGRVEQTRKGLTGLFTTCPVPAQPATCLGFTVNARNFTEEVGDREYHDELVWVDAFPVTIDATGIHIGQDRVATSQTDGNPPRFGGTLARVRIDGARSARVRGSVTLHDNDGTTHAIVLDMTVTGGAVQPFAFDGQVGSALCPTFSTTGHGAGVFSDTATTSGTMTLDGVALSAVPPTPGVQGAQLNSGRFTGTCDAPPAGA